jgi:hypothetical protein
MAVIPVTEEAAIRGLHILPKLKVSKTPSQQMRQVWCYVPVTPSTQDIGRRIAVWGCTEPKKKKKKD